MKYKYKFNDWMTLLDENKVDAFCKKVNEMAKREFGVDGDGDCPVEVIVLDRTRFEPMHYLPIEYDHKLNENSPQNEVIRHLIHLECNASIGSNALSKFIALMRHWACVREAAEKTAKESKK